MPLCQSTGMRVTKGDCRERKFSALLKMLRAGLPRTRKVEKCVVCAALLNMAAEPLAMCYPDLAGGTLRGRLTPRFRTIQVCPKDWPASLWQAEVPENRAHGSVGGLIAHRGGSPPCLT